MQMLIAGGGQIGSALYNVLSKHYDCQVIDPYKSIVPEPDYKPDILHICYGYQPADEQAQFQFINSVKKYQKEYQPRLTIIHATVDIGVSRKCNAVHSAVNGKHPNLESGIETFVKVFAGDGAKEAAALFDAIGIPTEIWENQEDSEHAKLLSLAYYNWCIAFEKETYKDCTQRGTNFNLVYNRTNIIYNTGWQDLGHPEYIRPNLIHMPGPVGGHCVSQNINGLKGWLITDILKDLNESYK